MKPSSNGIALSDNEVLPRPSKEQKSHVDQGGQEAVSPLFWKECDMRRRSEVLVTGFLRDALAVAALGVPELEARARATGLLGEGQSITHIKVFKRAKKSLGIRSLRAGQ